MISASNRNSGESTIFLCPAGGGEDLIGGYFSPEERQQIAEMYNDYQPVAVIACALLVDPSTIHRELKRGNEGGELDGNKRLKYDPDLAQLRFQENLRRRYEKRK